MGGITNQRIYTSDEPLTVEAVESLRREVHAEVERRFDYYYGELRQEADSNNPEKYSEGLKRKAETMYKYKFRFRGGGKRVDNMNFKFHCFVADSDGVEHHLFAAKDKGLIVTTDEHYVGSEGMYESAMPVLKIFTSTSGFGIPKEYFSFFFLLQPSGKKMVKIKPLGFDKSFHVADWYFLGAGRFLKREEIRKFFGHTSDTWKFYQRQSFLSKRRLLEIVEVGDNKDSYTGEIEDKAEQIRTIRID